MKNWFRWGFSGIIGGGVLLTASIILTPSTNNAQQTQQNSGGTNLQLRDNSSIVNNGNITFQLTTPEDKRKFSDFWRLLEQLQSSGDATFTQKGLETVVEGVVGLISQQELTRDVVTTRQFDLARNQTHSIGGTRNRVTFHGIKCGGVRVDHIAITLNGASDDCFGPGENKIFEHANKYYELVYDGLDHGSGKAQFTVYPIPEREYEQYRPIPDARYGEIFRWNTATHHCDTNRIRRNGQNFCATRPSKR